LEVLFKLSFTGVLCRMIIIFIAGSNLVLRRAATAGAEFKSRTLLVIELVVNELPLRALK